MNEYYKQALELISEEQNWKMLCLELAKEDPKGFCELVKSANPLRGRARKVFDAEGYVSAIKFVQQETGMGLKESVDFCKPMRDEHETQENV